MTTAAYACFPHLRIAREPFGVVDSPNLRADVQFFSFCRGHVLHDFWSFATNRWRTLLVIYHALCLMISLIQTKSAKKSWTYICPIFSIAVAGRGFDGRLDTIAITTEVNVVSLCVCVPVLYSVLMIFTVFGELPGLFLWCFVFRQRSNAFSQPTFILFWRTRRDVAWLTGSYVHRERVF